MSFSKILRPIAAIAIASSLLTACSLKLNDPQQDPQSLSVNALSGGCLSDPGTPFKKFFQGTISEDELDSFWLCLSKAFRTFVESTKGANPDYYTPEELRAFIQKFFMKNRTLTPEFIAEAMAFKQGVLGGRVDQITADELRNTLRIMEVFRQQSKVMRPYLPFGFDMISKRGLDPDSFENAFQALNDATAKIGEALQGSIGTYSFDHLDALITQMGFLFYGPNPADNGGAWAVDALRYLKIVRYGKSILVAPPADVIQKSDWQQVFYLVPRYFTLAVRTAYYQKQHDSLVKGKGLQRFEQIAADAKTLLQLSIANHPAGFISYDELDTMIDTLSANQLVPISADSLKPVLRVLFDKVFYKAAPLAEKNTGINPGSIDQMYADFTNWSEAQLYLSGLYTSVANGQNINSITMKRSDILAVTPDKALQWTSFGDQNSLAAIRDMQKRIANVRTVMPLNTAWVTIPDGKPAEDIGFTNLSYLNIFRSISALMMRGYGTPQPLSDPALTKNEVNSLWADFFPILESANILSESSKDSATTYMLEADMFTYAGVGNNILSINDALELEYLLLSVVKQAPIVHSSIEAICGSTGVDAKGNALIDATCYRNAFKKNAPEYWNYIPAFANYFKGQPAAQQGSIMEAFDALVRKGSASAPYQLSDTEAYILIPYYIEILFSKYDVNKDGYIDQSEGQTAYPTFARFLGEKATPHGLKSNEDWFALFTYLLRFQHVPTESLGEEARYVWWRYLTFEQWNYKADRGQIAIIFSKLLSFQ